MNYFVRWTKKHFLNKIESFFLSRSLYFFLFFALFGMKKYLLYFSINVESVSAIYWPMKLICDMICSDSFCKLDSDGDTGFGRLLQVCMRFSWLCFWCWFCGSLVFCGPALWWTASSLWWPQPWPYLWSSASCCSCVQSEHPPPHTWPTTTRVWSAPHLICDTWGQRSCVCLCCTAKPLLEFVLGQSMDPRLGIIDVKHFVMVRVGFIGWVSLRQSCFCVCQMNSHWCLCWSCRPWWMWIISWPL